MYWFVIIDQIIRIRSNLSKLFPSLTSQRSNRTPKMRSPLAHHFYQHFDQQFSLNFHNTSVKNAMTLQFFLSYYNCLNNISSVWKRLTNFLNLVLLQGSKQCNKFQLALMVSGTQSLIMSNFTAYLAVILCEFG